MSYMLRPHLERKIAKEQPSSKQAKENEWKQTEFRIKLIRDQESIRGENREFYYKQKSSLKNKF